VSQEEWVNELKSLRAVIETLNATLASLILQLQRKEAENAELKRLLFGTKKERLPTVRRELKKKTGKGSKTRSPRKPKIELPIVQVMHDITQCPHCNNDNLIDLKTTEESDEIEFVPAHFVRKHHVRKKKKCTACDKMVIAPVPERVTEGGYYGPGLHAHIVVSKCEDSLPIYRLAKQFKRQGFDIDDSTLNRLFHSTGELLTPIAKRILALIAQSDHINADETPLLIQAPEKCKRGYVWTFLHDKLIGYVFSESRSGDVPKNILEGTSGYLQVDKYSGYNVVCLPNKRERVGCIAHMRRRFFKALDSARADAEKAMEFILSLYQVEYEAASQNIVGTDKHLALRRTLGKERFDAFEKWMIDTQLLYPPKSPMGEALSYALSSWSSMQAIFDDARVRLDNNLAENALRIVAIGRKNFLFVGDEQSGKNLAVLLTVIATCKAHDINPEQYIADVLMRLGKTRSSEIDSLLPANWQPIHPLV
jgi:transposase